MDSKERNKIKNTVSYLAFESVQARNERAARRAWITNIILIIALIVSNAIWISFLFGMDFESYDYEQGDGINIIGDDNKEVTYNGSKSKSTQDDAQDGSKRENQAGESENG